MLKTNLSVCVVMCLAFDCKYPAVFARGFNVTVITRCRTCWICYDACRAGSRRVFETCSVAAGRKQSVQTQVSFVGLRALRCCWLCRWEEGHGKPEKAIRLILQWGAAPIGGRGAPSGRVHRRRVGGRRARRRTATTRPVDGRTRRRAGPACRFGGGEHRDCDDSTSRRLVGGRETS